MKQKKITFLSSFLFLILLSVAFKINGALIEWFWKDTKVIGVLLIIAAAVFLCLTIREMSRKKQIIKK